MGEVSTSEWGDLVDCDGELIGLQRFYILLESTDRSRLLGLYSKDGCDLPLSELISLSIFAIKI